MTSSKSTPSTFSFRKYLIFESILLIAFIYLIFFGGKGSTFLGKEPLLLNCIIVSLLAIIYMIDSIKMAARDTRNPVNRIPGLQIAIPAGIFLIVQIIAALSGIDPSRSLPEVWLYGIEILLFLLVFRMVNRHGVPGELMIKTLLIAGIVVSLFSWSHTLIWYQGWLKAAPGNWIPDVSYRLPEPNMMAVLFNLMLMPCLARLFSTKRTLIRIGLVLYALSTMALLFLTSSRGGWLGTAAGLFALAMMNLDVLRGWGTRLQAFLKPRRWLWVIMAFIIIVCLTAGGYLLYKQATQPTHGAVMTARSEFWPNAWKGFIHSPWLGTGPFTFSSLYMQANSVPPKPLYVYAHNIYLDVLHGSGLIGFATFLFLALMVTKTLLRGLKTHESTKKAVGMGVLAATAAFAVHGLFDSVHHTEPLLAMTLAILLGTGCGQVSSDNNENSTTEDAVSVVPARRVYGIGRILVFLVPLGAMVLAGYGWYHLWQVTPFFDAVSSADKSDWTGAVDGYIEAADRNPRMAAAYQQLGISLYRLNEAGSPLSSETDAALCTLDGLRDSTHCSGDGSSATNPLLDFSLAALQKTVELDPYYGLHWSNFSMVYLALGEPQNALAAAQNAADRAPKSALFRLWVAYMAEANGNSLLAADACAGALELDSTIQTHPVCSQVKACSTALQEWQAANPAQDARLVSELETDVRANPDKPSVYLRLADALLETDDLDQAGAVLKRAHFAYYSTTSDYLDLLALEARLQAALGNESEAQELQQQVDDGYANWGLYGPNSVGWRLYANGVYRVPSMQREMIELGDGG